MRKTGILYIALVGLALLFAAPLSFAAASAGGASITTQTITPASYSDISCDSFVVCKGTPIFDTIIVSCVDTSYTMKIVEGPGTLTTQFKNLNLFGYYSYIPLVSGYIYVKFLVTHTRVTTSGTVIDSTYILKKYYANLNSPPLISDIWASASVCDVSQERVFHPQASEPDGDILTFAKISGPGTVDAVTGEVRYTPSAPGVYEIFVAVYDKCGGDTASIHDTITVNNQPSIVTRDTTVFLCKPEQVCFNILASDADSDTLSIWKVSGPGNFVRVSNDAGWACFNPADVDSATYTFVYCVVDSCSPYFGQPSCAEDCATDTVQVTVIRNKPPILVCQPLSFFTCVADTFCFPLPGYNDPEFGAVTWSILSANAYLNGDSICLPVTGSGIYNVEVAITDPCGASDTCIIPVTVDANRPPVVVSADPFSITLCAPETICFAVNADDPDFDLASVTTNIGTYDPVTDRVCFTPSASGVYQVITTATDNCGASDADTTIVTVDINTKPVVVCASNLNVTLCGPEQVCVPVQITDGNLSGVFTNIGVWDAVHSQVCFTPDTAGTYLVTIIAKDDCQSADTAAVLVKVTLSAPPVVNLDEYKILSLCGPAKVCIPVSITGNYSSVTTSHGIYDTLTKEVCFDASESIHFYLFVTAVDTCGNSATDSIHVALQVGVAPEITIRDTSVYLCTTTQVCIPVTIFDFDNDLRESTHNLGQMEGGNICFTPGGSGTYELIVTALDSCGLRDADTAYIVVTQNLPPVVTVENDFSATLCGPTEVCVDASVIDNNLQSVITNIGTWDPILSRVCFSPDTAGRYLVRIIANDSCAKADTASLFVDVTKPPNPTVDLGADLVVNLCEPGPVCVPVTITGSNPIVTTNLGTYNAQTGKICFDAGQSAELRLIVTATDSCGQSTSDNIKISVHVNRAPVTTHMPDTAVYLCYPTYICLPLTVTDPDGNLKSVTVNRGQYSNGQVCFVPYGAGTYEIIATATDSCGKTAVDTANVVVTTDQFVKLIIPKDTTVFACDRDTFCFPIGGIPANATVSVSGINTWFNAQTQSVCFYVDCGVSNKITVTAKTPCNTFTGTFTVTVGCNRPPIVILPPDYSQSICGATSVCVPVGIADYDGNLKSVVVEGGTYDAGGKKVCFNANGAGVYTVKVTATDSCGAVDSDIINVTLTPNQPPVVTPAAFDTSLEMCDLNDRQQVCMTFYASDPNANLVSVVPSKGTYDKVTGQLCFNVEPGVYDYSITLIATDACGLADTSVANVHILPGDYVNIQCPAAPFQPAALCKPGQVCVPVTIDGANYTVTNSFGTISNGQLCFNADTSGTYTSRIIATSPCNADTCIVQVKVTILAPVEVVCPKDTTLFLCAADTICLPYTASASATSVTVSAPAYLSSGQICVPILQSGNQNIKIIASGACGADTCQFAVNATINTPPTVNAGRDTTLTVCQPKQVCIPFTYSDVNNNGVVITTSHGTVNGNTICFTPPNYGQFTINVTATDACGAKATDQVVLKMIQGEAANITCPLQTQYFTICGSQSVCVDLPITPAGASLTITPANATYDWNTRKLCIPASETGNIQVNIIASSQCGADTCGFTIHVDKFNPPTVTSPSKIDSVMCLTVPDTLCIPVTVTGTSPTVTVKPSGYYSAGYVCVPVTQAGSISVQIIASNACGADTSTTQVNVTADAPPTLHLPADFIAEFCPGDTNKICIDGIWGNDTRSAVTISRTCGAGTYTAARSDSGKVCFLPDTAGVYEFCFSASDGCASTTGSFSVTVNLKENCDVCVTMSIDAGECTVVGVQKSVFLNVQTNERIGGFDLLLSYDASVMAFSAATIQKTDIEGWEYFTYRTNSGGCGGSCPSGLIRFIGIAETNNGQHHPPDSTLSPDGRLIALTFLIANNQNLGDQFLPLNWVWYDCGDNSFSDPTGNYLFIDGRIFSSGGALEWDEADDLHYPEASRPFGLGATDACAVGGAKGQPLRCIDFIDGGVCVIHPESIDARGDINLNEISYEIADAVLFSNYFIYGLSVFKINIAGQIAASDVNADGLTLSVADLVQLIRVIVGDADPVPKLNPYAEPLILTTTRNADGLEVATEAVGDIGAMHLIYRLRGDVSLGAVTGSDAAEGMDVKWSTDGSELRVLVSDIGSNKIAAGSQNVLSISYIGDGALDLISSEIVDYQGQPYIVDAKTGGLPTTFALSQNYPNPFNPSTTISFALAKASEWRMTIFTVTGTVVREFDGQSEAGLQTVVWDGRNSGGAPAASGIYFYRLTAGQFSETKKMVLLK